jgi:uncharacterized protein YdhG (YjbR/CyaY superfamily)
VGVKRDVEEYLNTVPAERKARMEKIHTIILDLFPKTIVDMTYKMPTYRVGEGWVALANQKQYISVYTCGYHHIESFKTKHPKVKTGNGCINFRDTDEIPISDLQDVVRHAIEHPKQQK